MEGLNKTKDIFKWYTETYYLITKMNKNAKEKLKKNEPFQIGNTSSGQIHINRSGQKKGNVVLRYIHRGVLIGYFQLYDHPGDPESENKINKHESEQEFCREEGSWTRMVERKEIAFNKSGQFVCKWSTNLIQKHF